MVYCLDQEEIFPQKVALILILVNTDYSGIGGEHLLVEHDQKPDEIIDRNAFWSQPRSHMQT